MSVTPSEKGATPSPENAGQILERKFVFTTLALVSQMRLRGGNPFSLKENGENRNFVRIREVKQGGETVSSLDLYALGMWVGRDPEGMFRPIGTIEDTTIHHVLSHYAILTSEELGEAVTQATTDSQLEEMNDEKKPEEERQMLYRELVEPVIEAYIDGHQEELMRNLISDMIGALDRVLHASFTDSIEPEAHVPGAVGNLTAASYLGNSYPSELDSEFARRIMERAKQEIQIYEENNEMTIEPKKAPGATTAWYKKAAQRIRRTFPQRKTN